MTHRLKRDSLEGMKRLIEQRYFLRQNMVAVVGVFLTIYFAYNLVGGERSYLRLLSLNFQMDKTQLELSHAKEAREIMEQKVVMMRPGSVSRDLLEEQARKVLGYQYPDEKTLIKNVH